MPWAQKLPLNAQGSSAEYTAVEVQVIELQPRLILESPFLQNASVMLLDGEKRMVSVVVRNVSDIPLSVIKQSIGGTRRSSPDSDLDTPLLWHDLFKKEKVIEVAAGDTHEFWLALSGKWKANIGRLQYGFLYCCQQEDRQQYSRVLGLNLHLTINAAIQAQHLRATPVEGDADTDDFMLSFDLRNAWPEPLRYAAIPSPQLDGRELAVAKVDRELNPGQVERVDILLPRIVLSCASSLDARELTKALFETLSVTWKGDDRAGKVDLSGLMLSAEEVEIVTKSSMSLELQLTKAIGSVSRSGDPVVKVGSYVTLIVTLSMPPGITEPVLVRMHPYSVNSTNGDRTDWPKPTEFGVLQQMARPSGSGEVQVKHIPAFPVVAGKIVLVVTASAALGKGSKANLGGRTPRDKHDGCRVSYE